MGCVQSQKERPHRGEAAAVALPPAVANPAFAKGGGAANSPAPDVGGGTQGGGGAAHDAAADGPSEIVEPLLTDGEMPECSLLWVEGRNAVWERDKTTFDKQMRPAVEWALKALCHAHEDPRLKKAVRRLLAVRMFTMNLEFGGELFAKTLRPGLSKRLVELGAGLKTAFDDADLARRLSDVAVAEAVGRPEDHPLALERERSGVSGRPTQIDLLPSVDAFVNFAKPETFPDEVYAHAMLMVAAALDARFKAAVATAVREHNAAWERDTGKPGTGEHSAAPTKAVARVGTKVQSDYRYEAAPRAQHNVDVARCLVTADTPEELLALSGRLAKATFGGVVRVKNLFAAPEAERAERFHLLPLMLTVAIDADGETYREFVRRPEVVEAFDTYVAARDVTMPPHRWRETTALARAMLESGELSGVPVRLLGELQMVLTGQAKVRHAMHEVYKAYRAESDKLLWEDYARTAIGEGGGWGLRDELAIAPNTLWQAAGKGNRPAVETFLKHEGVDVNVAVKGKTALCMAAQKGFTDVVTVLLDDGRVDVNLGEIQLGRTPLLMAACTGHTDVVRLLLEHRANANLAETTVGSTPLMWAAKQGFVDIVRVLLEHGADVNKGTAAQGATALMSAAQEGHTDVVRMLLEHRANVNQTTTDDGQTPLFYATQFGHTDTMRLLIDAGADVNIADSRGWTALFVAATWGTPEAAALLRAAGATR